MVNLLLSILGFVVLSVIAGDLFIEERRRRRSLRAYFASRDR
jgi:hypothetical protein